jgi:hypothetical protein
MRTTYSGKKYTNSEKRLSKFVSSSPSWNAENSLSSLPSYSSQMVHILPIHHTTLWHDATNWTHKHCNKNSISMPSTAVFMAKWEHCTVTWVNFRLWSCHITEGGNTVLIKHISKWSAQLNGWIGTEQILAGHKFVHSVLNKEVLPQQWKNLLLYLLLKWW